MEIKKMKYCAYCGAQIEDDAVVCIHCGRSVEGGAKPYGQRKADKYLTVAAEVFMILACAANAVVGVIFLALAIAGQVSGAYFLDFSETEDAALAVFAYMAVCITFAVAALLPLAYAIPMTVHVFRADKNGKPLGTAFKVCTLIFINIIPGILLFIRREPEPPVEVEPLGKM